MCKCKPRLRVRLPAGYVGRTARGCPPLRRAICILARITMPILDPAAGTLLLIDLQARLLPVIENGAAVVANVRLLRDAARMLDVPPLYTEQKPERLGAAVPEGAAPPAPLPRQE